jgi:uncharacterized protein YdaU (DUF1376 family)
VSERPFMQLYVSDFIGDTLHLSTEQVGAYLLLLMAMWNAGGTLPDDEAKLARIVRLSVKKWRAVAPDLLSFFERVDGAVRHNRLTKEMQKSEGKSQSRASAGAEGGRAKALKDKEARLANASVLAQHLPDTRSQKDIEPIAQRTDPRASLPKDWQEHALKAAGVPTGFRDERNPGLAFAAVFIGLLDAGYDWDADIIAGIAWKPKPDVRNWSYFEGQIRDFASKRRGIASRPAPADPLTKLASWPLERWRLVLEQFRTTGEWQRQTYGPRPGEPDCLVPPQLLNRAA